MRYGENPHQKSILLKKKSKQKFYDNLIQGKELSFNNLRDIEVAFNCVNEFKLPTSVIVKHCSPCGAASDKDISKAFENSKKSDATSSFGGIIAINRKLDDKIARLITNNFYEALILPH